MKPLIIKNKSILCGKVILPGDKSIAHRALILSAITRGKTILKNFPVHDDSLATLNALSVLGVRMLRKGSQVVVFGVGKSGLKAPRKSIFAGNSGTTLRLLLGVLVGEDFKAKVTAGAYLSLRPMARVNIPLRLMGARINSKIRGKEEYAPLVIEGGFLKGITYRMPVASAQVKSAILLAGLSAKGKTKVIERISTRDHTERMLKAFGANIVVNKNSITLNPNKNLVTPGSIYIPGDISSAAFFMVLSAIVLGSKVLIEQVSLNPGRSAIIKILKRMKAKITVTPLQINKLPGAEPIGNVRVSGNKLKGTAISSSEIPSLIDELPILMVAACFAQGKTIIKGANELRVKETDRINSMVGNLKRMGADISVSKVGSQENITIKGGGGLRGARLKSFGDHRTAMSMIIAALVAEGKSRIDDVSCINKSFPGFLATLNTLLKVKAR